MAITQRTRIIANPARRRRNSAGRKMSAKQAAIFGRTPAIRARAKASLKRKRNRGRIGGGSGKYDAYGGIHPSWKRRVKKGHRSRSKRSRKNPGEIIGFTLANPARRKAKKVTAKQRKYFKPKKRRVNRSRKNPARRPKHRRRSLMRANPARRRRRSNPAYRVRRRRNPGGMGSLTGIITNAVFVLVGALGSKLGAQLILGSNNTSWVGYAGNAAVGVGLWFLTEHVMKNKEASSGVIAGTVVEIILRIINDMTPFGSYVSGLGMGDYQMQSFVTPQVLVDPYNSAAIQIPPGWAPQIMAPAAPAAAAGGSGMGSMYGDAYNAYSTYGY
jgi:hypothetical protein